VADELTATGLSIDDLETRIAAVVATLRTEISAILDVSPDQPTGQIIQILMERQQALAELIQAVHSATDPDQATGQSLDGVASITGTYRRPATSGTVVLTLDLDALTTVPAGSLVAVAGDPSNTWAINADVTSVGAGNYAAPATSTQTGPIQALAGTITVIVTPVAGWNSSDNAADAVLGSDEETDTALRLRREVETVLGGSTSADAIRAEVSQVDGVLEVFCLENPLPCSVAPMPPNSVEVVYWDGGAGAADQAEIAEVIWTQKPAGIRAYGTTTVVHTDEQNNSHQIGMTVADEQRIVVDVTLLDGAGYVGDAAVMTAIAAWADANLGIGDEVWRSRISAVVLGLAGVENVSAVLLSIWPAAVGAADITIDQRQIATISTGDITVIS